MIWKKYTIDTTAEAVDFISEALSECGVEGIEIEDSTPLSEQDTKEMFVDILPDMPEDDGSARVTFYLDSRTDPDELAATLAKVHEALAEVAGWCDAGPLTITSGETADEDWLNNWKKYFHPFTVDDILIKPTWEETPEDAGDKLLIEIDPGAAFGTGSHETTKLCTRALRRYIKKGDRVLDVGTGSGILSIIALRSGASYALGTDLDPSALTAARDNARVNHIRDCDFDIIDGNIIDDDAVRERVGGGYDLVCANILAPAIIMLTDVIPAHIKSGGIFVVSGIIDSKEADVRAAFESNPAWELLDIARDGEWVGMTARRR